MLNWSVLSEANTSARSPTCVLLSPCSTSAACCWHSTEAANFGQYPSSEGYLSRRAASFRRWYLFWSRDWLITTDAATLSHGRQSKVIDVDARRRRRRIRPNEITCPLRWLNAPAVVPASTFISRNCL